jgi:hypothetical protein
MEMRVLAFIEQPQGEVIEKILRRTERTMAGSLW